MTSSLDCMSFHHHIWPNLPVGHELNIHMNCLSTLCCYHFYCLCLPYPRLVADKSLDILDKLVSLPTISLSLAANLKPTIRSNVIHPLHIESTMCFNICRRQKQMLKPCSVFSPCSCSTSDG